MVVHIETKIAGMPELRKEILSLNEKKGEKGRNKWMFGVTPAKESVVPYPNMM